MSQLWGSKAERFGNHWHEERAELIVCKRDEDCLQIQTEGNVNEINSPDNGLMTEFLQTDLDRTVLYRAYNDSILSFTSVPRFENLSLKRRNSLNQIFKWSSRLIRES